jgi:hypothetical protein
MRTRDTAMVAVGPREPGTPFQLRRLLIALLAATAFLGITAAVLQRGLLDTTQAVRDSTSPAYLDAVQARAALSDADRAAWQSFRSGEAQFTGPGQQYQNDITTAGQALERLAALDAANSADSSQLQTISGQLVNYEGLVEEADAEYRRDIALGADSKDDLGYAYLAYASSALRDPQGGLLASISHLVGPSQQAVRGQMSSLWADPALLLIFAVPVLALLAGLILTQNYLQRRFRRMVSPPLLGAAVLVIALSGWMVAATIHADSAFATARSSALPSVSALWQAQTKAVTAEAAALQSGSSGAVSDPASGGLNATATVQATSVLNADLAAADDAEGLTLGIPALALVIAALSYLGLRPRLNEYRGISDGY